MTYSQEKCCKYWSDTPNGACKFRETHSAHLQTHTHILVAFDQSSAPTKIALYSEDKSACSQSQTDPLSTVLELAHHSYCSQLQQRTITHTHKPEHCWTAKRKTQL